MSWSSAAASTSAPIDRDPAAPRSGAASKAATSATARACAHEPGGGSRESSREAASTRPGPSSARWYPTAGRRRPGRTATGGDRRRAAVGSGTSAASRDRAQERERRVGRRAGPPLSSPGPPGRASVADGQPGRLERHGHRPVAVRPEHAGARGASRSSVARAGWPYGLPAPAEATATARPDRVDERLRRRRPAAVVGDLEEVEARQAARRAATGRSPPRRRPPAGTARSPTAPSSTTDTLLMPVPPSGGSRGTRPRTGHRTRRSISSTASRSPAARPSRIGAPADASAREPRRVARPRSAHARAR